MQPFEAREPASPNTPSGRDTPIELLWQRWRQECCPDFSGSGLSIGQALAVLRFDQHQRWQAGDRRSAEQYLQAYPALKADPDQALVLIYGEFLLRQELGETPDLGEYLQRFPEHTGRLRQQDEFHRAMAEMTALTAPPVPPPEQAAHCRIEGEIARGGMGVILRGHDEQLGRALAVKVLREEYRDEPDVIHRFLEEARVSGQLQHPGVVPVHELGRFADGRPYFTMKLVEGQTLADLLAARTDPALERTRFLKVFEQICQTVAYAHARGVIHRDLKSANVMVGAFGEVQVMDWGLAKRLRQEKTRRQGDKETRRQGDKETRRQGDVQPPASFQTPPGAVIGTPAYMAPEQARGETETLDERCDVFGLGAILCEVLTGQPPRFGMTLPEALRRARQGDQTDALARLAGCGADAELIGLTRDCLATAPANRPRHAGVVAERLAAYLAGVEVRLRQAELERAAAQARAEEEAARAGAERRARRLTLGLAAAALAVAVVIGGSWVWMRGQRVERTTAFRAGKERATGLLQDGSWGPARAAILALPEPADTEDRQWSRDFLIDLDMLERVTDIRASKADRFSEAETDHEYARAFRDYGLDIEALDTETAAKRIRARPEPVARELVGALMDWAHLRGQSKPEGWQTLIAVARAADQDPWRMRIRELVLQEDFATLRLLASDPDVVNQSPHGLHMLGLTLADKDLPAAVDLLRRAQRRYPSDAWINYHLGFLLERRLKPPRVDEALSFYRAAAALRPELTNQLAKALATHGNLDEALALYREQARTRPHDARTLNNLGATLFRKGEHPAALAALDEALRLQPDYASALGNRANALTSLGRHTEALAAFDQAQRLLPSDPLLHFNRALTLYQLKQYDDALAACDRALQLRPEMAEALYNRGRLLLLVRPARPAEALRAFDRAVELEPKAAVVYSGRGEAHMARGEPQLALTEYDRALAIKPDLLEAHHGRFDAFLRQKQHVEALAAADRLVQIQPDNAEAHANRGLALGHLGRLPEALAALDQAIKLKAAFARAHHARGQILKRLNRPAEALAAFEQAVRRQPGLAEAHNDRADMLLALNRPAEALAAADRAIALKPELGTAHGNRGVALLRLGRPAPALEALDRAVQLQLDVAAVHHLRGQLLVNLSRFPEAAAAFREAIRCQADLAESHLGLGLTLQEMGQFSEALAALRRADELGAARPGWKHPTKQLLRDGERLIEVDKKLPALLRGEVKPEGAQEMVEIARVCHIRRRRVEEVRYYLEAFAADAKLAADLNAGHRYHAACAAAALGGGRATSEPPLDEPTRARHRQQALDWLRAELAQRTPQAAGSPPERAALRQVLLHWRHDPDWAGLREEADQAKLPGEEREAWSRLWADVDALLKQTAGPKEGSPSH